MKRNRQISSGRHDGFAIEVAFLDDPNPLQNDERAVAKTWGALKLWIGGTNFGYVSNNRVEIERLLSDLDIPIFDIELSDREIRALAVVSPAISPFIAVNTKYREIDKEPRRFTLAHELCHLLHDHSLGLQMAMATSPWAPRDIERRANAFAARFLMPYDLTYDLIRSQQNELKTPRDIWKLASSMSVSFSACVYHLCNLNFLSWFDRDRLIETQLAQYEYIVGDDVVKEDAPQAHIRRTDDH